MELRGAHPEVESVAEWPRGRLGYRDGPSVAAATALSGAARSVARRNGRSLSRPSRVRLEVTGPALFLRAARGMAFGVWLMLLGRCVFINKQQAV